MISWIRNHRLEVTFIVVLLIISAFLRFYRLPDYMTFLGDEGRDALMIKRILVEHDFPLLGPPTSVGNIYLGPLYYYMMVVPMTIWWLNPVAAAGMISTIGVATVFLVYYLARRWFGFYPAVLAGSLYALSSVNIIYSRSSWNPNPAPFFALVAVLGFDQARQTKNFLWLVLTGGALAAAVQMHYLALILLPIFGLLWLFEYKNRKTYLSFVQGTVGAVILFLFLMSPLVIFDFRYNFLNSRAMMNMFGSNSSALSFDLFSKLSKMAETYSAKLLLRYLAAGQNQLSWLLSILVLMPFLSLLRYKHKIANPWAYKMLGIWLLGGLVGLSFYKGEIYDHYLGFLNPVPFLLLGGLIATVEKKVQVILLVSLVLILGFVNLEKNPLLSQPNLQLQKTQEITRHVISEANNKPFNFALLSKNNYDAAYQFYLNQYGFPPKQVPIEITDQLFVVCEDEVCNPVGHPKYEIAGFGWVEIAGVKEVSGVKVFKLIPFTGNRNSQ